MRHRSRTSEMLVAVGMLLAYSCSRTAAEPQSPEAPPAPTTSTATAAAPGAGPHAHDSCPMADADVRVTDTESGVALAFETDGDVDHLRRHVERMASKLRMHGTVGARMCQHGPSSHTTGDVESSHGTEVPIADASVESTERGASLLLVPERTEDVERLRQWVREHADHMRQGHCRRHATMHGSH